MALPLPLPLPLPFPLWGAARTSSVCIQTTSKLQTINTGQINTAELNRRKRLYDSHGVSEQFHYVFDLKCGLQIDASAAGNLTRFMNHHHEKSNNANVRAVLVNDCGMRRVVFRARRDIVCGEEMCCESSVHSFTWHTVFLHFATRLAHHLIAVHADDYGSSFTDFCGIELVTS